MLVSNESKLEAFKGLLKKMNADEKSFVIAVYGESVTLSERAEVSTFLKENYPEIEFYEIDGEQKVYEFIIILE